MKTVLDKLIEKQGDLSGHQFAKKLKTSQQLWQATRTGRRPIGLTIIKGFAPLYPDLALDVLSFLGFDVKEVISLLINRTDAPETSPGQKIPSFWHRVRLWHKTK